MSDAPRIRICKTCVAWQAIPFKQDDYWGTCHMVPPSPVGLNKSEEYRERPMVRKMDWCMQWAEDRERVVERIKEVMVEDAK